jgi:hypothetical protein
VYKKGPLQVHRTSRNRRVSLPLRHLIPGQKVKKGLSNRISVLEGVAPGPAAARRSLVAGGTMAARPCVQEATRREGHGIRRGGPAAPAQRQRREAGPGRGRPAGPSGTGRTAGRLVSAGRRLLAAADALPVTVLAVIAGAGSFTHIRDTAAQHGQPGPMSWAVAVCIDLTCVMAARERQRDKQHGSPTRRLSWPTCVLAGGILLSLAANLAQAQPDAWGRIVAAVPSAAFLVAVSMIERRAARRPIAGEDGAAGEPSAPGRPSPVRDAGDETQDAGDEALLALARRAAADHHALHGQPITRDALRARLGVSNQAASDLLRQLRAGQGQPPGTSRAA